MDGGDNSISEVHPSMWSSKFGAKVARDNDNAAGAERVG
jgi:hypothetical protein